MGYGCYEGPQCGRRITHYPNSAQAHATIWILFVIRFLETESRFVNNTGNLLFSDNAP